ncbi:hypothetical protein Tco_0619326 [Tanacetum coccineum]
MILSGADNRPPMLDKDLYDLWKSRIEFYMQNREHGRMILESVENGPLIWPTVEENRVTRTKKYGELSTTEKIQADCDMKATNIILQGLRADIYSLVNHHRVVKDLWERVQLLMQGESLHKYYLRFTHLINDMNIYNLKMDQFQVNTKFLNSLPPEWSLAVPIFSLGDDPIACLNKAMAFLTAIGSSRFSSTNNQLRTSSNLRNQATIQDDRDTVQQVQGRQGQSYSGIGYKSNATSSGGNNASGQARVVKCYNCQAEAQEARQILDEEQLSFLADPGVIDGQAVQTIIPNNAAFQTEDLDTYDSDCDDISNAKAVLMANISNYGSDVISEDFEQSPVVDFTDNKIHSDSNIIPYSQYLQETQLKTVQDTTLQAQQDSMILSVIKQMSKQMINHVTNWEKANKE